MAVPYQINRDGDDQTKRANANAGANAMIVCMRYYFGIPSYRLASMQSTKGVPLPEGTQWMMIHQVYLAGIYLYEALVQKAAAGKLLLYDDTPMRVSDLKKILQGKAKGDPDHRYSFKDRRF